MALDMRMPRSAYEHLEAVFHLSPATLSSFCLHSGSFSSHSVHKSGDQGQQQRLNLVLKVPQKIQIANYILSLSHHIQSGWTTAFICGEGAANRDDGALPNLRAYQVDHIRALLEVSVGLWASPFLIPTALMFNHCHRTRSYTRRLEGELTALERHIGVTYAGQSYSLQELDTWPEGVDIKSATIGVHSTGTQLIFVSTVYHWADRCIKFLLEEETQFVSGLSSASQQSRQLQEMLRYQLCLTHSYARYADCLKERVQAQTSVVRSNLTFRTILFLMLALAI